MPLDFRAKLERAIGRTIHSMNKYSHTHGGNVWDLARRYYIPPQDILDFSTSVNPFAPPQNILDTIHNTIKNVSLYPDPGYVSIKEAISSYIDVPQDSILAGNGSTELIYLIPHVFQPQHTVIITPTFSEYEKAIRSTKGRITFIKTYPEDNFRFPIERLNLNNIQMLFICNPNNPTGTLLQRDEIVEILGLCKKYGTIMIIDEAFIEFIDGYEGLSLVHESVREDNLIVIRSLTKIFTIPGLRIGYMIGNPDTINKIKSCQSPWSVNCFAEAVVSEIVKNRGLIKDYIRLINREKAFLLNELKRIRGIKVFTTFTNFILISIELSGLDSKRLWEIMGKRGILIRECSNIRGLNDRYVRVAVRRHEENQRLIKELKRVFNAC